MRNKFDMQLELLNEQLIHMGELCEVAINRATDALKEGSIEKAHAVRVADEEIDQMEKDIERLCLKLLLQQQPVARDLRSISTALKIVTDMERIGDQAADIADISMHLRSADVAVIASHLEEMAREAVDMVHSSIDAFVRTDVELAKKTIAQDDAVDALFIKVRDDVTQRIRADAAKADEAIDVMMVAKYLERIGDHAVNICEWVEFYTTGEHKNTRIL